MADGITSELRHVIQIGGSEGMKAVVVRSRISSSDTLISLSSSSGPRTKHGTSQSGWIASFFTR